MSSDTRSPARTTTDLYKPLIKRRGSKDECPFHAWLPDGRPDPPAGRCGPNCWLRPIGPQAPSESVSA